MRQVRRRTRTATAVDTLLERGVDPLLEREGLRLVAWLVRRRVVNRVREWLVDLVIEGPAGTVLLEPECAYTNLPTAEDELDLLIWGIAWHYRRRTEAEED